MQSHYPEAIWLIDGMMSGNVIQISKYIYHDIMALHLLQSMRSNDAARQGWDMAQANLHCCSGVLASRNRLSKYCVTPFASQMHQRTPREACIGTLSTSSTFSPLRMSQAPGKQYSSVQSSRAGAASTSRREALLVVGPGVLGGLVGKLWHDAHTVAEVVGQTNTTSNHERLKRLGLTPRVKGDAQSSRQFPNVLFSAPPSGSSNYIGEIQDALELWNRQGTFAFTSSSGVLKPAEGEDMTEKTALHPEGVSERTDRLLRSERVVRDAGGCIVRLVGLYHAHRGAHTFFLRQGEVQRWGGRIVNLIHYEDAANLCCKVFAKGLDRSLRDQVFFGTDCHPLTFQEMMDATVASGAFEGSVNFTGAAEKYGGPGSSNMETQKALAWAPKYSSFTSFMSAGATDFYTEFDRNKPS